MFFRKSPRQKELERTNYGRSEGWVMYVDGVEVATLTDPIQVGQFWVSYVLTPKSDDCAALLNSDKTWIYGHLVFKSIAMNEECTGAYVGGETFINEGRVLMRGLYLK